MRILQVLHDFIDTNPFGTELYTYYLSKQLQRNHDVAVLYYGNDRRKAVELRESRYDGIRTFIINIPSEDLASWSILNYCYRPADALFSKALSTFKPHVIHFQHLLYSSMNFPGIAKASGCALVHTLHDFYLLCPKFKLINNNLTRCAEIERSRCFLCCLNPCSRKNLLRRLVVERGAKRMLFHLFWKRHWTVSRKVYGNVDLFISPSIFLRNKFLKHGLSGERIIHCDNGMNFGIKNGNGIQEYPGSPMTFGYIGSFQVEKGLPLLIEAFNGIEGARLYIYGRDRSKRYQDMARNPDIHFRGAIGDGQKQDVFSQLDALIVPSIWFENSPLTIHEAFMFGTPVITSNIGGMAELVEDGISGLHFRAGDVSDLREKIMFCIAHPESLRMMAKKVPKVKSIEENALELENIYFRLLKDKRAPVPAG